MECECKRGKYYWEVQARKSEGCVKTETERERKGDGDTRRAALAASCHSQWSVDRFNKSCVDPSRGSAGQQSLTLTG